MVIKRTRTGALYGMTDPDGRTVVEPEYDKLYPLSTTTAVAVRTDDTVVIVDRGRERPAPFAHIVAYDPYEGPRLLFGVAQTHVEPDLYGNVSHDLTLLQPTGTPGPTFSRVPEWDGIQDVDRGSTVVVTVRNETGERGSAIVDAAGQVVWAGPETASHVGSWEHPDRCRDRPNDPGYLGRFTSLILGPSPVAFGDPRLLRPLDAYGSPIPLPDGVIGLTPIVNGQSQNGRGSGPTTPCAAGWVVVSRTGTDAEPQYSYRVGGGEPAAVVAAFDRLTPLDEIRMAELSPYSDDRLFELGTALPLYMIVAKQAGEDAWSVIFTNGPMAENPVGQTWGTTAIEAADAFVADLWAQRQAREARTLELAAAQRAWWEEQAAFFDANIDRARSLDPTAQSRLRSFALRAGGDRAARYWAALATPNDARPFCDHVEAACWALAQQRAADEAAQIEYARRRSAIDAAFDAFARGPSLDPDIRVTIYEGGRSRTEVMSRSHFNNIYRQP